MTAGDVGCETGYYCDGISTGACQAKLASGISCSADYMCTSGTCLGLDGGAAGDAGDAGDAGSDAGSTCM
jgi:hypothetical protein